MAYQISAVFSYILKHIQHSFRMQWFNNLITLFKLTKTSKFREQIDNITQIPSGNEIFSRMPQELCLQVVDYLYLEDILRSRLVCRQWYHLFCNSDMCAQGLKKYFALPLDYYYKRSTFDCHELDEDKRKEDWLRRFMINRIRREHGIASRTFQLDKSHCQPWANYSYSNGRVLFKDTGRFLIEDLITRQHSIFPSPPHTEFLEKCVLSDQYLLVPYVHSEPHSWEIVGYDLTSERISKINISADIFSLSAYKNQIGIVTAGYDQNYVLFEALVWKYGEALRSLHQIKLNMDTSDEDIVAVDIFFHVINADFIFIVYHSRMKSSVDSKECRTKVTVLCFEAGKLVQTQCEIIRTMTRPEKFRSFLVTYDNIIGFEAWETPLLNETMDLYNHVTYDMSKRKFNSLEICPHPTMGRICLSYKSLIWRDQICNPVVNGCKDDFHVITISKSLTDHWHVLPVSTFKSCLCRLQSSILSGETRSYNACAENVIDSKYVFPWLRGVWGDDRFVVVDGGASIQVWQFDDLGLSI